MILTAAAALLWYILMLAVPAGRKCAKNILVGFIGIIVCASCFMTEYGVLNEEPPYILLMRFITVLYAVLTATSAVFILVPRLSRFGIAEKLGSTSSITLTRAQAAEFFRKNNADERKYPLRMLTVLLPLLLLLYMYEILGISEVFFGNSGEWAFVYSDVIIYALIKCAVVIAVFGFIVPIFVRGRFLNIYALVISSLGIASYIQSLLMNYKVGLLNGNDIDWLGHTAFSCLNCAVWLIIIALPLVFHIVRPKAAMKATAFISGFLLAIQLVPYPMLLAKASPSAFKHNVQEEVYDIDGTDQYCISGKENVVVFILDAYGNEFFDELLAAHPEYNEILGDYTYYNNVNSDYRATSWCLPSILTSTKVDPTISIKDSNKKAWTSESANIFYRTMQDNGYIVNLYTDSEIYAGGAENMLGKINNIEQFLITGYDTDRAQTYKEILKISRYKYMPYFLKSNYWVNSSIDANKFTQKLSDKVEVDSDNWQGISKISADRGVMHNNYDFYGKLKQNGLTADTDKKYCVIQHLFGAHDPLQGIEMQSEHDKIKVQMDCMKMVLDYTDEMKRLGVYDSSTIIITADHGRYEEYFTDPLFLIKLPGETHDVMKLNTAPGVIQTDTLPTILDSIGLSYDGMNGISLLDLDQNAERERYKYTLDYSTDFKAVEKCDSEGCISENYAKKFTFYGDKSTIDLNVYERIPLGPQWF